MMLCSALKTLMVPKVAGVFITTGVQSCKWSINIKWLCQRFSHFQLNGEILKHMA